MSDLYTVFVYGTLMPGERNAHVAGPADRFTARAARLPGFRLFHLSPEGYPGIIRGAGEVWGYALTYAPAAWVQALPLLDRLEGVDEVPPLYTRERVRVRLEDGEEVESWVYIFAHPKRMKLGGLEDVPGGDWRTRAGRTEHGSDER